MVAADNAFFLFCKDFVHLGCNHKLFMLVVEALAAHRAQPFKLSQLLSFVLLISNHNFYRFLRLRHYNYIINS